MVLHFDFFSAGCDPKFDFVEGERKEKSGGWVSIWGEARWVGVWGRRTGGEAGMKKRRRTWIEKNRGGDEQGKVARWEKRRRTGGEERGVGEEREHGCGRVDERT